MSIIHEIVSPKVYETPRLSLARCELAPRAVAEVCEVLLGKHSLLEALDFSGNALTPSEVAQRSKAEQGKTVLGSNKVLSKLRNAVSQTRGKQTGGSPQLSATPQQDALLGDGRADATRESRVSPTKTTRAQALVKSFTLYTASDRVSREREREMHARGLFRG